MAEVKTKKSYSMRMTKNEAESLRVLLGSGVSLGTLNELGLKEMLDELSNNVNRNRPFGCFSTTAKINGL